MKVLITIITLYMTNHVQSCVLIGATAGGATIGGYATMAGVTTLNKSNHGMDLYANKSVVKRRLCTVDESRWCHSVSMR